MKQLLWIPLCALMMAGTGCQKVNEATEFDISYTTQITVPAASVTVNAPVDFVTPEVSTETASKFAENKTTRDLIDEIVLTKFVITSQTGNLDYLKSLNIYIRATGLTDLLIATKSNIPAGSKSIAADPTNANIREHLFKEKVRFRLNVTAASTPTVDQQLKLDQTVHVKGKQIK
jgi:hypothetical protein